MTIYILLTTPSTDAGPFNLYSNVDYSTPLVLNVSKQALLAGYPLTVPNGTTIIRAVSVGELCTNYLEFTVNLGPVPTSTTTSTTTANPALNYWYYGKYESIGGVVPIPTSLDINISTGIVVTNVNPAGTIVIPFNSATDDFLWFAIPVSATGKTNWFVSSLNQGLIGGPVSPFGNLFPDPVIVVYNTIPLYLYISTGRTNVTNMTMSGSIVVTTTSTSTSTSSSTTTTTTTSAPQPLILTFDNISNANLLVGDASDVSDWNTFFDLPIYGNPFTSVTIVSDSVHLYGGSNIIVKDGLFSDNYDIIKVLDYAGSMIEVEYEGFFAMYSLIEVNLPSVTILATSVFSENEELAIISIPNLVTAGGGVFTDCSFSVADFPLLTYIGSTCFTSCVNLQTINLPLCTNLGGTVGNNFMFYNINGNPITLTVPSALMTCNSGNPDGDIQYLQANNTVTIITV